MIGRGPGEWVGLENYKYILGWPEFGQMVIRTVAFTLAAFHPDVKRKLAETGLLMPTVQMILLRPPTPVHSPPLLSLQQTRVYAGGETATIASVGE